MYFNIVQPLVCKNCDAASPSIILAGRALLVKMRITHEPHGIFGSNFVYSCILTLSSRWYEKKVTRLHRASFWHDGALSVKCS